MGADSRIELTVRLWSTGAGERFAEYLDRLTSLLPRHRGEVARRIDSVEGGPGEPDTVHVRGSGCTFAAATAAALSRGEDAVDAIRQAKAFVTNRLRASQWVDLDGAGPVAHWISG